MKRLSPLLLIPPLILAGCAELFGPPPPDGGGPAPAAGIRVADVTGFDGRIWDGSVLGTWTMTDPPRWTVRNTSTGDSVTIRETRRSDCCIWFQENDGSTMVADFQAMEVRFGGNTLAIGDVSY
jgi:hypothetical protein